MRKPKQCVVCKKEFIPRIKGQLTCANIECKKKRQRQQQKEKYWKNRTRKKYFKHTFPEDSKRDFQVIFFIVNKKWYWEATGDNGSKLANGPFDSIKDARADYEKAV